MAISKDRLEKEVVAQKYRAAKIEAEALAQKKKAEAIAHLESQGQRVQGVEGFSKKLAAKTADNTLALLLGRKAITTATEAEKIKEQLVKAALIRQQDEIRRSRESKLDKDDLPPNWESVLDIQSQLFYYWNRITNVTTWEKPEPSERDDLFKIVSTESEVSTSAAILEELPKTNSLLPGWEERNHSATLQSYYVNIISGEVRSVKPTLESCNVQSSEGKILETRTSENKKRPSTSSFSGDQLKFQRHSIDPLDVSDVE